MIRASVIATPSAAEGASRSSSRGRELLAAIVVASVIVAAVFAGDGSGNGATFPLGAACIILVVLALVLASCGVVAIPRLDPVSVAAVAAATALTLWLGLTIVWSVAPDLSWGAFNKGLVYLVALLLGIVVAGTGPRACRVVALAVAGALAIALIWALAGKAIPSLFADAGREARLRDPVGYWNALALIADAAIPLGLWIATKGGHRLWRAAGGALVYIAALSLLLTLSRAGVVAGVAGLVLWAALSRARVAGLLVAVLGGVPAIAVATWAFTRPALVDNGASYAARVDDGAVFGALALIGAVAATCLVVLVPVDRLVAVHRREVVRGLAWAGAALLAAGVIGLVAAVGNPVRWAGDQLDGGGASVEQGPGRLTEAGANNRLQWWGEAIDVFRAHPVRGAGVGTFRVARTPFRDDGTPVGEPHSVPLQLLAGGGIVALLLLVALVGVAAVGVTRGLSRLHGHEREAAVALTALPLVYVVHALVDYDLDLVAVTVPMLVVVGVLLGAGRPLLARATWLVPAAAAVVGCAIAVSLAAPWASDRAVTRSSILIVSGDLSAAAERAERARRLNPLSVDAVYQSAYVATTAQDFAGATRWYEKATSMQPENAETWLSLGTFLYALYERSGRPADACAAYGALNHAYTLDPRGRQWIAGGSLDIVRDAVNNGACEPAG